LDGHIWALKANSLTSPLIVTVTDCNLNGVQLIIEIHEIQFSEVTNYRNPRNPPLIGRNPHAKKRNPTPATKSTATPPKDNYRNPPALDCEPRFLNVVANTCL